MNGRFLRQYAPLFLHTHYWYSGLELQGAYSTVPRMPNSTDPHYYTADEVWTYSLMRLSYHDGGGNEVKCTLPGL